MHCKRFPQGILIHLGGHQALRNVSGTELDLSPVLLFISQDIAGWMDRWKGLLVPSQVPPYFCGRKENNTGPESW